MKIKKNNLISFLLIFPFIKPGITEYIPILDNVYNVWRLLSFVCVILMYFNIFWKNKLLKIILVMQIVSLAGTVVGSASLLRWLMTTAIDLSGAAIIIVWQQKDADSMIKYIGGYINILLAINFIFMIVKPGGVIQSSAGSVQFLDLDNLMTPILLFSIIINIYAIYYNIYNKKIAFFFITVAVITPFVVKCGAMIISLIVVALLCFLTRNKKILNKLSPFKLFLAFFVVCFLVVYSSNIDFIYEKIKEISLILGKTPLSGRPYIWRDFFSYIKSDSFNAFMGTGVKNGYYFYCPSFSQQIHPHNQLLFVILETGFIGFAGWILLNIVGTKKWKKTETTISRFTEIIYFAFLVAMIVEVYRNNFYFYAILTFMYILSNNNQHIIERCEKDESQGYGNNNYISG